MRGVRSVSQGEMSLAGLLCAIIVACSCVGVSYGSAGGYLVGTGEERACPCALLGSSPLPAFCRLQRPSFLSPARRQGRHNGARCRRQPHGEYQQQALPRPPAAAAAAAADAAGGWAILCPPYAACRLLPAAPLPAPSPEPVLPARLPPACLQGYANPAQYAAGIHLRLYARTFIAAEAGNPSRRFAFVNIDAGMASQAVTFTVVARLKEQYGGLYSEQNVAISGTHTHSGPAGGRAHVGLCGRGVCCCPLPTALTATAELDKLDCSVLLVLPAL